MYKIIRSPKNGGQASYIYTIDGQTAHEQFNQSINSGEYHILLLLDTDRNICLRHWRAKG